MSIQLSKDDWAEAGLKALAAGGTAAVSVERLAARLGSTKGSFYWHFQDRAALVEAALVLWEDRATDQVIFELNKIVDPGQRLSALFDTSFGGPGDGLIEADLATRTDDPVVAAVTESVTRKRISFLEQVFVELGLAASESTARAITTYAVYLGYFQIAKTTPDLLESGGEEQMRSMLRLLSRPLLV